jgi:hypothetical protein
MDPDRRNRVCDVYHRALGRRPEERSRPCSGTSHHSPIVWRAGRCPSPTLTRSRTTVLDFGLTMTIWTVSGPSVLLTRSTVRRTAGFLGTPAHLNPERTRGQAVDGRTDTWALEIGSVWTELLRRRQLRPRAPATVVDCRNAAPPRTCCALYNEARGSRRRSLRRRHTAARDEIPGTLVRCTVPLLQRTPHWPPSRVHTSLFTVAGMWRDSEGIRGAVRGVAVAASFARSSSASKRVSARSKIAAGSPFGIECRSRSWTLRSLSCVLRDTVNWTL